jgi:hypothetical protein
MRLLLPAIGIVVLIATGLRTPDPFFVKTSRCGGSNGWRPRLRAKCKQTGYEDAPGARGTSSITGAVVDCSDAIKAAHPEYLRSAYLRAKLIGDVVGPATP